MKLKSPVSYYGGKALMVDTLLSLMPTHKTYVEAFAGGASLYFAKPASSVEVLNDKNGFVAAFYRVIKTNFEELNNLIQSTIHDQYTYNRARDIYKGRIDTFDLEKAWAFWVGCNMSFGGSCFQGSFALSTNTNDKCTPATKLTEKKKRFLTIADRLEGTMVLEMDAIAVIKRFNNKECFIYCDPPYLNAHQGHYRGYTLDMFIDLLEAAANSKSKIMISCYWHDVILDYLDKFIIDRKTMTTRISPTTKEEIIIRNYKVDNCLFPF